MKQRKAKMEAKLRVVNGAKPALIRLKLPTTIGRSGNATLTIKSSKISRNHCEIDTYEGELTVRDLGSSNGTFVNGQRITDVTFLSPGDELRIGPLTLVAEYEIEAPAETPAPAPEQVIDDQPKTDALGSISSVVHYQENADGSFLGIEELTKAEEAANASEPAATDSGPEPSNTPATTDAPTANAKPSTDGAIDLGITDEAKQVDPGDSQLNKFFEGLS